MNWKNIGIFWVMACGVIAVVAAMIAVIVTPPLVVDSIWGYPAGAIAWGIWLSILISIIAGVWDRLE